MQALKAFLLFSIVLILHSNAISKTNQLTDSTSNDSLSRVLKEVVISASKTKVYADHDEMKLSPENIQFGTNALDAISSLPMFISTIAGEELYNIQNKKVNVVINGKPSDYSELMAYTASQIKNINYYPYTPTEYRLYYNGPVIEVSIKRPSEIFFNSSNRAQTIFESPSKHPFLFYANNEMTQNTLMDETNLFRLSYTYNYSYQNHISSELVNNFGNNKNIFNTSDGHNSTIHHYLFLNYQYNKGNTLFSFITIATTTPKNTNSLPMKSFLEEGSPQVPAYRESLTDKNSSAITSSIFFDKIFDNGLKLMLDLQGRISWIKRFESLKIAKDYSKIDNEYSNDFINETTTKNKNYTLQLSLSSNKKIGDFKLNMQDRLSMSWLNQTYQFKKMPIGSTLKNDIGVGFQWQKYNFSLDFSISYIFLHQRVNSTERKYNHIPTGSIVFGQKINDCFSLRGNGSVGTSYKNIGTMLNNKYYDSENYYQKGNFNVKPTTNLYCSASLNYISKDRQLSSGYTISFTYTHNAFFQFVLKDNDDYVQTTMNTKYSSSITNSIYFKYSPSNCIKLYANLSDATYRNPHGYQQGYVYRTHNNFTINGQIMFKLKDWNMVLKASSKDKSYNGDQIFIIPMTLGFELGYRFRNWYFQGLWRYNYRYVQLEMKKDDFLWRQDSRYLAKNIFAFNLTYNFRTGKPRYKETKSPTISNDTGLLRDN